jgi:arginyl-tRNA synthetase
VFGKLALAYNKWGSDYDFESDAFGSLYALYVRFHEEAEKDESLEEQGSAIFKRMEEGDKDLHRLWQKFVDISMVEYNRMWKLLGVEHVLVRGESFYNDRLKDTEQRIEEAGLLEESEGAMVVDLEDQDMPPCLIRKSDGASLYATRDLASAIYRAEELHADLNLYVTGQEQDLHFKQIFAVLKKMKFPWAESCHHVSHGLYRFKDVGKMSSRKGQVIRLKDVLEKAISMVRKIIEEKNPDLEDKDIVARQVGVGAIIFNDLVNDRVKNVEFDWERVLDFEGDSGPYVQYMAVRCRSLLRKAGGSVPTSIELELSEPAERELVRLLLNYEETLNQAFKYFKPHYLATYLLDVCRAFSQFYHHCRILGDDQKLQESRLALVWSTLQILQQGLAVLNIETPEYM